ncbi:MAG: polyphosphate kinase [Cyanobacteria bacterium QS_8_64_29]|nr:MAG: polyphosphate kinase [Cyanobacteria bacterium QS_8_64_29]
MHSPLAIAPDSQVELAQIPTKADGGYSKADGKARFKQLRKRLAQLQEILYAQGRYAVLAIFEAIDAGGKDSTITSVFRGINPQGMQAVSFKAPTPIERQHDFLWRVHQHVPPKGHMAAFSRSHYQDILVARVEQLVPEPQWQARYAHINAFERLLRDEGTQVLKFFLHISPEYQQKRLQRRLERPDKRWKLDPSDLQARARWDAYQAAFEAMLARCSTEHAPWYVIPAERRWYRNLAVAQILVDALESLDLHYPQPDFDPAQIRIP